MIVSLCLEEKTSIILVGGNSNGSRLNSVEVIGDKKCSLPQLPYGIEWKPQVVLTNNNELLICCGHVDK